MGYEIELLKFAASLEENHTTTKEIENIVSLRDELRAYLEKPAKPGLGGWGVTSDTDKMHPKIGVLVDGKCVFPSMDFARADLLSAQTALQDMYHSLEYEHTKRGIAYVLNTIILPLLGVKDTFPPSPKEDNET